MTALRSRRFAAWTVRLLLLVVAVGWFGLLRPQSLGGPAGYVLVSGVSMQPMLQSGDLVVAVKADAYQIGDVIAYQIPMGDVATGSNVIHRIVGGSAEEGFITEGDNTSGPDPWRPKPADVIGRLSFSIPKASTVLGFLRSPLFLGSLGAAVAVYYALGPSPKRARVAAAQSGDTTAA